MNISLREEVVPLTPHAFHVLLALAERPMYGYGIIEQCQIDAGTTVTFTSGSIYKTLALLVKFGYIEKTYQKSGQGSPHARQYYAITGTGKLVLKFESHRYEEAAFIARYRLANLEKQAGHLGLTI